jgi:hypothetical protein
VSTAESLLITPFLVMPVGAALLWKTTMLDPTFGIVNFVLRPFGIGHCDWISRFPLESVMIEMIWQWTPFMMLLVLAGLQSQPKNILKAAACDGARPLQIFRELTLPHLRRYIELGVVLGAIYVVNDFDAGFIGSPAMNRLDGSLTPEGISVGGASMRPPDAIMHAAQGHSQIVVGIRPEHLSIGEGHLETQVDLVEDLGSDFYVYGHLVGDTGANVIVRAGRAHPRPGEIIKIKIDTSRLHLFDAETGVRIGE